MFNFLTGMLMTSFIIFMFSFLFSLMKEIKFLSLLNQNKLFILFLTVVGVLSSYYQGVFLHYII
ncbi:hypothetical protein bthur0002_58930 [Bacillus thuringiensis Bt407]|nr:hypothetical protein bthur0002_58930 [Bacillus thuringiensis Bt407]